MLVNFTPCLVNWHILKGYHNAMWLSPNAATFGQAL